MDGPIVLVAHSVGCLITVHWAQRRRDSRTFRGESC
nr:alpha/beta hydrolase [Cupriavidus taiwanensis]